MGAQGGIRRELGKKMLIPERKSGWLQHPNAVGGLTMKKLAFLALATAAIGGLSLTSLPSTAIAKGQCNGTTKPCPLQKWMRDNVGTPMASGDFAAVAKGIEKIQTFGGPDMKDWTKMAKKTVDDLKANKSDDVKADCKTCHDAYKDAYKNNAALRKRPIP